MKEDAGEQYLVARGFTLGKNLQSNNKYEYNYEKFKLGRVDLWISIELNPRYLIRRAGEDPARMVARAEPARLGRRRRAVLKFGLHGCIGIP